MPKLGSCPWPKRPPSRSSTIFVRQLASRTKGSSAMLAGFLLGLLGQTLKANPNTPNKCKAIATAAPNAVAKRFTTLLPIQGIPLM